MSIKELAPKARRESLQLNKKLKRDIMKVYIASTDAIAAEVEKLKTKGRGKKYKLTIASKEKLTQVIKDETVALRKAVRALSDFGVTKGVEINAGSYTFYTDSLMAELDSLDQGILSDVFAKVNSDLVAVQLAKTYDDGLTYSNRIWKSSKNFQRDINNVIAEGLARNRDVVDISKDLEVYVRTDKKGLAKRYANIDKSPIRPGETEAEWKKRVSTFNRRISTNVEYNSLRIVRSNLQGAIQDSNIACQSYTPSVKEFNWTLSPAHKVYSICEDIVAGNPWTYDNFAYSTPPHPNCLSYTVFVEIPEKQFIRDLRRWDKNPTSPGTEYLNEWKEKYYTPMTQGDTTNYFNTLLQRANTGA